MLLALSIACLLSAAVPAVMFCLNLKQYRPPAPLPPQARARPAVSVLIPARDEEQGIAAAVASVLASVDTQFEVVVMDDASTDRTAEIVTEMATNDRRVRLEQAPPLPPGWNGKQHACWALAHTARHPLLCFLDADVRLQPHALARTIASLESSNVALLSGFPRQLTITPLEWLLLPLIHFILLGFLPVSRMRASTSPAMAAGCGQFMLARADSYFAAGGHAAIRETMHDGLRLPRLFREHGLRTDLVDLTPLATCRMYRSAPQVWQGLAKNATEGLAAPARILPITLFLLLGQVLPFVFVALVLLPLAFGAVFAAPLGMDIHIANPRSFWTAAGLLSLACLLAWLPRLLATIRFRQPLRSALLHALGIALLLALQWYALIRKQLGGAVRWKQRAYP